jgi:hypothetical protein
VTLPGFENRRYGVYQLNALDVLGATLLLNSQALC